MGYSISFLAMRFMKKGVLMNNWEKPHKKKILEIDKKWYLGEK
jgi:hypothetical protein